MRVSAVDKIADAHLSYDGYPEFEAYGQPEAFLELTRRCKSLCAA